MWQYICDFVMVTISTQCNNGWFTWMNIRRGGSFDIMTSQRYACGNPVTTGHMYWVDAGACIHIAQLCWIFSLERLHRPMHHYHQNYSGLLCEIDYFTWIC